MTSSAAAGVYLERHVANLRLGMSLELFTAIGALVGGTIAFLLDVRLLEALFAGLLVYVAITMLRRGMSEEAPADEAAEPAAPPEATGRGGSMLDRLSGEGYRVRRPGLGVVGATFAGIVSALLGIGGGIIKVPLMNVGMGVPLRVATATSNLMIGITAAASAIIYLLRGEIDPYVAGADRDRRLHRRERRLAPRPPRRPAVPALALRAGPALHGGPDAHEGRVVNAAPSANDFEARIGRLLIAMTYVAVTLLVVGVLLLLAAGTSPLSGGPAFHLGDDRARHPGPPTGGVHLARPAGRAGDAHRPCRRRRASGTVVLANGRWSASRSGSSSSSRVAILTATFTGA